MGDWCLVPLCWLICITVQLGMIQAPHALLDLVLDMHDMALALEHVWFMILNHRLSGALSRLLGNSPFWYCRRLCCKCRLCHTVHMTPKCDDVH